MVSTQAMESSTQTETPHIRSMRLCANSSFPSMSSL